jgi:hypothetical protein
MSLLKLITFRQQEPTSFDPDAQAFITATGITDLTEQNAVDVLVKDLKNYNLWSKMKAIYPMVGGTATAHKYNLKDPRDLDAAFRIVFNGTWNHTANGADPVSSADADTRINALAELQQNNTHASIYLNENISTGNGVDIGGIIRQDNESLFYLCAFYNFGSGGFIYNVFNSNFQGIALTHTDTRGFWSMSRLSSSQTKAFKNGAVINTRNITSTAPISANVILARNQTAERSTRRIAFASFGEGMTDQEFSNLYTAVQTFQTTLGRQV